jgi:uroporphyrinogen-III decarboxylase
MNHVERFRAVMDFKPVDRLPQWEWAMWWDKTITRWHNEGLPKELDPSDVFGISQYLGLDPYIQFWFSTSSPTAEATQHHTQGTIRNLDDYRAIRPYLFPDHSAAVEKMSAWYKRQQAGEVVVWATLEGFFWMPRTLMDVEFLSYAYYDQPELIHAINSDLLEFNIGLVRMMKKSCVPTFVTLAEDMSYNHGPMISQGVFEQFNAPYYKKLLEHLKDLNVKIIADTDGDVTLMVPWLQAAGIDGVLPLERQANVDGNKLRKQFPDFCMAGHFNKMIMREGETAMRKEFERLVPLMKSGGFIPSVDHQTPPDVSLQNYQIYLKLLREYTKISD